MRSIQRSARRTTETFRIRSGVRASCNPERAGLDPPRAGRSEEIRDDLVTTYVGTDDAADGGEDEHQQHAQHPVAPPLAGLADVVGQGLEFANLWRLEIRLEKRADIAGSDHRGQARHGRHEERGHRRDRMRECDQRPDRARHTVRNDPIEQVLPRPKKLTSAIIDILSKNRAGRDIQIR